MCYRRSGYASPVFRVGSGYLNLTAQPDDRHHWAWWGRAVFSTSPTLTQCTSGSPPPVNPTTALRDASWGERYFHVTDADGHELGFARLCGRHARRQRAIGDSG